MFSLPLTHEQLLTCLHPTREEYEALVRPLVCAAGTLSVIQTLEFAAYVADDCECCSLLLMTLVVFPTQ